MSVIATQYPLTISVIAPTQNAPAFPAAGTAGQSGNYASGRAVYEPSQDLSTPGILQIALPMSNTSNPATNKRWVQVTLTAIAA